MAVSPSSRYFRISSGEKRNPLSCSWKMVSRSAVGILFRHFWQTYLGVFEGTYIFSPQWQRTRPGNRWAAFLAGRLVFTRRSSRNALHSFQRSSETMGSTSDHTHSSSGFWSHFLPSPVLFVQFARRIPLAVGSWIRRLMVVFENLPPPRGR